MAKDKRKLIDTFLSEWEGAFKELAKGRKDPKGKAKPTQVHRDKTKYKRRSKHVRDTEV